MPTLSIKKVPVRLYAKLKKSAAESMRSLNSEAIFRLEQSLGLRPADTATPAKAVAASPKK